MAQKMVSPQAGPTLPFITADATASGEADVLREVEVLLGEGRPAAALERIGRSRDGSPWLANAAAVCQLRMGDVRSAVETFRRLVLAGGLFLRDDVQAVFKVNFAAALIADGNLTGGLRVLDELRQEEHPAVREIRDAVRRWEEGMTFWQKIRWYAGGRPPRPLVLDFPPGRLHEP
jgi:hypothetical protein